MSTVSIVPALIARLIEWADDRFDGHDVIVDDGSSTSASTADVLYVGLGDPDSTDMTNASTSSQEWAHAGGTARDEKGTVTCVAMGWNGNGDVSAARERAFWIVSHFLEGIREAYTLGLDGLLWISPGTEMTFDQGADEDGAGALITFQISFSARI